MERLFSLKNFRTIMDHISDGVQVFDSEGNLVYCNRRSACWMISILRRLWEKHTGGLSIFDTGNQYAFKGSTHWYAYI